MPNENPAIRFPVSRNIRVNVTRQKIDGIVIDESCDQDPKLFDLSVSPALEHRKAFCRRIGVPKRAGHGAATFKKCFEESRSRFPVEVSEVRAARDPMTAVATGLLVVASMDD